jgi:preprotein translocase subunit SecB
MKKENQETQEVKAEEQFPSVSLNGQYIKELHLDNTNSPSSFVPQKESPKIEIAVNFNHRNVQENVYEVVLAVKARAKPTGEDRVDLYEVKLSYAGLVTIENITDEAQKETILMIHVPTLLFPYARSIISEVTKDSGFQPLMLEPLDFARLHEQRKAQKEATNQTAH